MVYFDSSVFLAIFNGESSGAKIRSLIGELRRDGTRIATSIITVQEVSVLSFRAGVPVGDNHSKVSKMARIQAISKEVALTAAKIEAQMVDRALREGADEPKSHRRKWDCFHLATALSMQCSCLYTLDRGLLGCSEFVEYGGLRLSEPTPTMLPLFNQEATIQ